MLPLAVSKSIVDFLHCRKKKSVTINSTVSLSGGCINDARKILTSDGVFFIKYNLAEAFPRMFESEAAGLNLLRDAGEIHIPEVIHHGTAGKYAYLLLEFITSENRSHQFWSQFGRSLAALHKHSQTSFGLNHDNYIGSLPQSNRPNQDWDSFFILERLEPMARKARDKGEVTSHIIGQIEAVGAKLSNIVPIEKPALLHGDLWSGNYIVNTKGSPCLIDPAVYYGHRETDLAMTRLFGGFSPEFYESYQNAFPLEKGWEKRADIFNLYPLLVHVNLFGGGYVSQVKQILDYYI
jgi:protein-ribulosamine 3-kinase